MKRKYIAADEAAFALRTCADAIEKFGDDDLTPSKLIERVFDFVFATIDGDLGVVVKEDSKLTPEQALRRFGDMIDDELLSDD